MNIKKSLARTLTPSMIILGAGGKTAMRMGREDRRRVRRRGRRGGGLEEVYKWCDKD